MTTNHKLVVTASDAASLLCVSDQKVYQLISAKQLEAYKDGKAWKIKFSSIEDYVQSRLSK